MRRFIAVLLLSFVSHAMAAPPADPQPCDIPPALVTVAKPLTALQAAIADKSPLRLLAVGSGATAGGVVGEAYPYQMLAQLRAALPQHAITLVVRGGRGMAAVDMLPLLETELKQSPPQVVIWQTGTVEAIRAMRGDHMRQALNAGLTAIKAAGGSLVLVDPQFTRALRANTDLEPYEAELQQVAALPPANLFRRFELTRNWALSGKIDPERAAKDDRDAVLARLNACLGEALARYLLNGAGVAGR